MSTDVQDRRNLDLLSSLDGQRLLSELSAQEATPDLRLGTRLRERYPAELVSAALGQHELRLAGRVKFERAMDMYFTRGGLEQASSEVVSRHRASRFDGADQIVDLCCGIGGDALALCAHASVTAVDVDAVHLRMAELNAAVYGYSVATIRSDVRDVDFERRAALFIDPARRSSAGRFRGGESEPPLEWCLDLAARAPSVGIKAAPGISRELIPAGWELEMLAVGRGLKEAVLWSPSLSTAARRATILPDGHTLVDASGPEVPVRRPGSYLVDPNPAVTRAGVVEELARQLDAWKIDEQIAFLSADHPLTTPFGRSLRVLDSAPWNLKRLRATLRELDVGALDIRRRGLAGDVEQIRQRLRPSGSRRAVLAMTRVQNQPWALVCEPSPP